ncbi:hypothetical protein BC829DRAFT_447980 [Chytridium lagenaria]|nr:hypothetical protein BC829DRAFT_447980 [Chytridium lagenaria]
MRASAFVKMVRNEVVILEFFGLVGTKFSDDGIMQSVIELSSEGLDEYNDSVSDMTFGGKETCPDI